MIRGCEVSTAVLTAVSADFWNIWKSFKTRGRTHFLDLAMKYKVVVNWKAFGVCEVSTAVLTAVSANFLNIQKCLKLKEGLIFRFRLWSTKLKEIKKWSEVARCQQLFWQLYQLISETYEKALKLEEGLIF